MAFLRVTRLTQRIKQKTILHEVSCQADLGQLVALLGPNGAGKTTLLRTLIGSHPNPIATATDNIIAFGRTTINTWPLHQRVAAGLVYLPQHSTLFAELSVKDNLRIVFDYHPNWRGKSHSTFDEKVNYWLEQTTLNHALHQTAGNLSGGQKRKLEVVRSLLMNPKILLLDEPFAGVDPKSIYELKKIFTMLTVHGVGVVISDHHVDQLLSMAQFVYVIMEGRVITQGTTAEILTSKHTQEHYLGQPFYEEIVQKFLV